jgi:hypothetical protein
MPLPVSISTSLPRVLVVPAAEFVEITSASVAGIGSDGSTTFALFGLNTLDAHEISGSK